MSTEKLKREPGFRDLILFYIVSGLSLRWIATAAASGQSAIVVWLLAWVGFFLSLAGCVLELSSRYPQEGGLYGWTREAYGEFAAFMAAGSYQARTRVKVVRDKRSKLPAKCQSGA